MSGIELPEDLLARSAEEAVRRICLHHLEEARAACGRLDDPADAEALHDFRVAVRRLRSQFRGFRDELAAVDKKDIKALRGFQEATGAGRDAEVLLLWLEPLRPTLAPPHRLGFDWLANRLETQKTDGYALARTEIRKRFERFAKRLYRRLERMDVRIHLLEPSTAPTFAGVLADKIEAHVVELRERLQQAESIDELEQAHRARIAGKRLRYLVDPVRPYLPEAKVVTKQCRALQDVLGSLNDAEVLRTHLERADHEATAARAKRLHDVAMRGDEGAIATEALLSERSGVVELSRRLRIHLEELFGQLQRDWQKEGLETLEQATLELTAELRSAGTQDVEVERKFLLSALPDRVRDVRPVHIEQGWLPGKKIRERLRRST
ncbi:MAG: CHAD domain-containing protein, partial [Myxococcota bacterium]